MAKGPKEIDFPLPLRGINQSTAYHEIPAGFTNNVNNVLALDSGARRRIGKRPGASKFWSFQFGGGAKLFQHISVAVGQTVSTGSSATYVIIVCGGRTYRQVPTDVAAVRVDNVDNSQLFSAGRKVTGFTLFNKTYLTDGLKNLVLDHEDGTLATWAATVGTFPVAGTQYPRLIAAWRGRAVLAQLDKGLASTIFFSAQYAPTDFDYGAVPTPTIAVATDSNFKAGQLGERVTALIPVNEDRLVVGTDHGLYEFVGDPADGGTLQPMAESVGVLSDTAWCSIDDALYFIGTGGFYRSRRGMGLVRLSDAWPTNFLALPQSGYYYSMVHDRDRHGIWVFASKQLSPWTTKHFFYDLLTEELHGVGGFWPASFPATTGGDDEASGTTAPAFSVTKCASYDGTASTSAAQLVLMGCKDGYVRVLLDTNLNDDSTAIGTTCDFGPIQPAGATGEAMLNGALLVTGEQSNFAATYQFRAGKNPYLAYSSPTATNGGSITVGGRQGRLGVRLSANSFLLRVSDASTGKTWAGERFTGLFEAAGMAR